MNKEEIDQRLEKILDHLEADDTHFQSTALDAFNNLIKTESLSIDQKKVIIPFLEKTLNDQESPLLTNCFKTIYFIGRSHFELVKDLFPNVLKELEGKDRFRLDILIDLLIELRTSKNPFIQDFFKQFIKDSPLWFDEAHLLPILERFWKESLENTFQFIERYLTEISESSLNYPDSFSSIKDLITNKLNQYQDHLEKIKAQQEHERQLREDEEKRRLEQKEKEEQEKLKREADAIEMRKKLQEYVKSIDQEKPSITTIEPIETDIVSNNIPINNIERIDEAIPEDTSSFTTFTSLGLKRKDVNKEDES